jgi:hypothetical protein
MKLTWRNVWFESKAWLESELGMLLAWSIVVGLQTLNELLAARDWINWTGSIKLAMDRTTEIECAT